MDLRLKVEGECNDVRDFIHFIRTDDRYARYTAAKYVFSPKKDQVELVFVRREDNGARSNERDRERVS
jgi:hypothetical protein